MKEHPDSLWQPYPDEIRLMSSDRPERRSWTARYQAGLPERNANRAVEILEERYARGEIDRRELEERRAVLWDAAPT